MAAFRGWALAASALVNFAMAGSLLSSEVAAAAEEVKPTETKEGDANDAKKDETIDRVVVTGEKTKRTLQDTPTSVAVTTEEKIEEENIQDFFDIVNRTPNVTETYGPSGFTLRGIANDNVSGGGNGGLATIYVDNVPIPEQGIYGGPLTMWDVRQVEILRGPQSTLQGRNALAGAVIIRTNEPTWDWEMRARSIATDADEFAFAFAGGGPIIEDTLAFRVAVEDVSTDGFIYNLTRNENASATDILNTRAKLLLTLPEVPDLILRASYTRSENNGGYQYTYSRTDVPDYFHNRYSLSDAPEENSSLYEAFALEGNYALNDRLSLNSISSWSTVGNEAIYDGDSSALPLSTGGFSRVTDSFTQELRLNYDGELIQGLVGLYYAKRDVEAKSASVTLVETPVQTLEFVLQGPPFSLDPGTAAAAAALYASALPAIPVDYTSDAPQEIETSALFADGRVALGGDLWLLAGFRYDREKYSITSNQTAAFAGVYPDPTLYGPYEPIIGGLNLVVESFIAQASVNSPKDTREFEAFLPKVGLSYDWTEDLTTSFVVQRGYRSGGSQTNVARSLVVPFDPEFTWNYDLSFRSTWLDGRLIANANAFYIDWTDQQVSVNFGLNTYDYHTVNAGKSHLYGLEFELQHQPSDNFHWYASLGYVQTKFDEFAAGIGGTTADLSGSEFAYAPHWTGAIGATYTWDNGFFANLNASFRHEAFAATGVDQSIYAIDARSLVNGKIGYTQDHWAAYVFANNLFDEAYVQYPWPQENLALLGDPRVVGLIVETKW